MSRALVAAARMEGGQVYLPAHAPWLEEWESELLLFPNGRHDDQVEPLAYAAQEASGRMARFDLSGWDSSDLHAPNPLA